MDTRALFRLLLLSGTAWVAGAQLAGAGQPDLVVNGTSTTLGFGNFLFSDVYAGQSLPNSTLTVGAGATLESQGTSYIGYGPNANISRANVAGAWISDGGFILGQEGDNNLLDIVAGGAVTAKTGMTVGNTGYSHDNTLNVSRGTLAVTNGLVLGNLESYNNSLNITAGGTASADTVTIGSGIGSHDNSITVSGAGASLSAGFGLIVGDKGTKSRLDIGTGAAVSVNVDMTVGNTGYSYDNTVSVSGALSVGNGLVVGNIGSANNALNINAGGNVSADHVIISSSNSLSRNNSISVSGAGASLTTASDIIVGVEGTNNRLDIGAGGTVTAGANVTLGNTGYSHDNAVTVGGALAVAGDLTVGKLESYNNSVTIQAGATASAQTVATGDGIGSHDNAIAVSGAGAELTSTLGIVVGDKGSANQLRIAGGGKVTTMAEVLAGNGAFASGNTIAVDGAGSELSATLLGIGVDGASNSLAVSNGGIAKGSVIAIGANSASTGNAVTVSGATLQASGALDSQGVIVLGLEGGNNTMDVSAGGHVTAVAMGIGAASNNNVLHVSGQGSSLTATGGVFIGEAGSNNAARIDSRATADAGQFLSIGGSASASNNALTVDGLGSSIAVSQGATIGNQGSGNSFTLSNGGAASAGWIAIVGADGGERNSLTVTGASSTLTVAGRPPSVPSDVQAGLYVGMRAANNSMSLRDGAQAGIGSNLVIGSGAGATGNTLSVTGAGTSMNVAGLLRVGDGAAGNSATIDDGAHVSAGRVSVSNGNQLSLGRNATLATGALDLSSASTLSVFADDAVGSTIKVSGQATLHGKLEAQLGAIDMSRNHYTILQAGSLTGAFDQVMLLGGGPAAISARLAYSSTEAWLQFTSALIANAPPLSGNAHAVASALDDFYNNGGTLSPGLLGLYDLSGDRLASELSKATGEVGASGGAGAVAQSTASFMTLLSNGHATARGSFDRPAQAADAAPETGIVPVADAPPEAPGRSVWASGYGGLANLDGSASTGSHDTSSNVYGVAAGLDFAPARDTRMGFAAGGGSTSWDLSGGMGSGSSTYVTLGGYAAQDIGNAYVALTGAYAWHSMETNRSVGGEALKADFNANNLGGRAETGYRLAPASAVSVTPYGALQAQAVFMPGYNEQSRGGADDFALSYDSQTTTALRGELGVWLDAALGSGSDSSHLFGRLAYAHDWTSDPSVQASFQSIDMASFTVDGAEAPSDLALITAGADIALADQTRLAASFDGAFASGYQSYAGNLALRVTW